MRRRRPESDDWQCGLVHAWFHWAVTEHWDRRTGGPRRDGPVYAALGEAAGRLLSDEERAAVATTVEGRFRVEDGVPVDRWPRPDDETAARARHTLESEAGVRFVDGHGWTVENGSENR